MSVNRDNIRAWVQALRSGEYEQGCGRLRTGPGHCCLGVACEVYLDATGAGVRVPGGFHIGGVYHQHRLPPEVSMWLFDDDDLRDPVLAGVGATALNDTGCTFAYIADLIEAAYLSDGS